MLSNILVAQCKYNRFDFWFVIFYCFMNELFGMYSMRLFLHDIETIEENYTTFFFRFQSNRMLPLFFIFIYHLIDFFICTHQCINIAMMYVCVVLM